jgi:hypothetical protein
VSDRVELLTAIARCPVVEACLTGQSPTHPCSEIVSYQWPQVPPEERLERWRSEHHLPEPWVGHIETAPLLFLSSNPNLASQRRPGPAPAKPAPLERLGPHTAEDHPSLRRGLSAAKWEWSDEEITDRFSSAFDVFMTPDGTSHLDESGKPERPIPYWQAIKKIADHLYGHPTRPGIDYALTEVVRCKSPSEIGVPSAVKTCGPRYLRRTLALSPATVICVVGRAARLEIRREYSYPHNRQVSEPMEIEGRTRLIVFIAGPNARTGRTAYPKTVPQRDVGAVREHLAAETAQ